MQSVNEPLKSVNLDFPKADKILITTKKQAF